MIMANTPPSTHIQSGSVAGRLSASKSPVRSALKSFVVIGCFIHFCHTYSASNALAQVVRITSSALTPKFPIPTRVVGINAITTSRMMDFVDDLSRTWGDDDTFNNLSIINPPYCARFLHMITSLTARS